MRSQQSNLDEAEAAVSEVGDGELSSIPEPVGYGLKEDFDRPWDADHDDAEGHGHSEEFHGEGAGEEDHTDLQHGACGPEAALPEAGADEWDVGSPDHLMESEWEPVDEHAELEPCGWSPEAAWPEADDAVELDIAGDQLESQCEPFEEAALQEGTVAGEQPAGEAAWPACERAVRRAPWRRGEDHADSEWSPDGRPLGERVRRRPPTPPSPGTLIPWTPNPPPFPVEAGLPTVHECMHACMHAHGCMHG